MDVFAVDWTNFKSLAPIQGIEKITWVERYNQPGEFTIVGNPVPLLEQLPLDKFISHSGSEEVMVVEEHYIDESTDSDEQTKLVVKGTSLTDYIMKNRVVSYNPLLIEDPWGFEDFFNFSNRPAHYNGGETTYYIGDFLLILLQNSLKNATGTNENVFNLQLMYYELNTYLGLNGYATDNIPYLSDAIYKLLLGYDIGLKASRPSPNRKYLEDYAVEHGFDLVDYPYQSIFFVLHDGSDLSDSVIFNFNDGDIHKARYFWSNKNKKNAYYVANRNYAFRQFDGDYEDSGGWARKVLRVDFDDYEPDSSDTTSIIWSALYNRGQEAYTLANSENLIIDAIGSKNSGPKYGFHYRVGDIVQVVGNYGVNQKMRVSEVALIQDGTEEVSIPVLKPVYLPPGSPQG